jgi:hypothetical protein
VTLTAVSQHGHMPALDNAEVSAVIVENLCHFLVQPL